VINLVKAYDVHSLARSNQNFVWAANRFYVAFSGESLNSNFSFENSITGPRNLPKLNQKDYILLLSDIILNAQFKTLIRKLRCRYTKFSASLTGTRKREHPFHSCGH
jgi:hypothetical protein